ncbi:MAG: CRTAC1 family protein, partial [Planctomycetaceae bacterium]
DGDLDIFLPGGGRFEGQTLRGADSGLFRNDGAGRPWTFQNVAAQAGVRYAPHYSHGAAVGDYDNDGLPDVCVTGYGGLTLFHNMGDGSFVERAKPAGLVDNLWSSSAAWGDVNGDGHLDLYIVHDVNWTWENHPFCTGPEPGLREICPPRQFQALPDTLYVNNGDGSFRDVSRDVGLSSDGKGLGVVMADLDLDGHLDIYVANDTVPNNLYRNQGTGHFEDIGLISGTSRGDTGVSDGSMGVEVGDFNNDGLPDIFVSNYERESFALYRNDGAANFTHVSQRTGITALGALYVSWGTVLFDFDADGDEDVFISNGHVIRYPQSAELAQKPILLENRNAQRFVNVASQAGDFFRDDHMGRGVAVGDLDNDGDGDLVVVRSNQPVALLANETQTDNAWIGLRLIGTSGTRDPTGALLFLQTTSGRQMRQIKGGTSYASTCDSRVFFGLGKAKFLRLEIRWPAGKIQTMNNLAPNQLHTIIEPR